MRVKLSYHAAESVLRQSPDETGVWNGNQFFDDEVEQAFDAWVVYEDVYYPQTVLCDESRVVFVTGEPASVRAYDRRFLAQFAAVVTPQPGLEHPRLIYSQPAIPWWIGVPVGSHAGKSGSAYTQTYDTLSSWGQLDKPKLASVICSTKSMTDGHRARLRLLSEMRGRFAGRIDFFGHGFKPVLDKWDAIAPYRYHVVLENTKAPHYWTEKLADCYLGGAFPIYCGCPNLDAYFPAGAYASIDRANPSTALQVIDRVLTEDAYLLAVPFLKQAKNLVLDNYNLFPAWSKLLQELPAGRRRTVRICPHRDFTDALPARIKRAGKRIIYGPSPRSG